MHQSEQIDQLAAALAKAQAAIRPAVKDKTNPAFRSKYADLSAVWEACREALTSNGLSVVQFPVEAEPGRIALETTLLHASGQWLRAAFSMPLAKNDPQGAGSGLSYARRYALAAVVGVVADDDDDGNAASQAKPQQKPQGQQAATYEPQRPAAPRLPSQVAPEPAPAAVDGLTVAQAEGRFIAKYGPFEEHYAGIPRPTTVAGWISAGQALRNKLQQEEMDGADAQLARNGAAGVAR